MNCVCPYVQRDSGLSLAAVYKECFVCEVVCVCDSSRILLSATWHLGKEKQLDLKVKKN